MEWDSGNAAWMLTASSLVLLMTPGLALFYGGMSRAKSVLNMMMMSFGVLGVVGVIYVLWGWSMSYGTQSVAGIFNNPFENFGLSGAVFDAGGEWIEGLGAYPQIIDIGFQVTFAIITTALISGALAERVKFSAWMIFAAIWVTLAYFPMAHMVWGGGLLSGEPGSIAAALFGLNADGVAATSPIDFAGGTVVHINAGIAALVLVLVIGKRKGFGSVPMKPHNLTLTMLGAGLLWFGWFGFNAGSAFAADGLAGWAWLNTTAAAAAAILGWLVVEHFRDGHATSLGAASGVVAGLVAITPAAGAVNPVGAIILGAIAGVCCAYAVGLKYKLGFDDSLDVVGVHLVGGLVGTVLIGFLAVDGSVFFSEGRFGFGGFDQLWIQIIIALVAIVFSAAVTYVIALGIKKAVGWRISEEAEVSGIDLAEHRESAYEGIAAGRFAASPAAPVAVPPASPAAPALTTEGK